MEIKIGDVLLVQDASAYHGTEYLTQIIVNYISDKVIKYTEVSSWSDEKDIIRYIQKDRFFKRFEIVEKL